MMLKKFRRVSIFVCVALGLSTWLSVSSVSAKSSIDEQFTQWLKSDLWPEAKKQGVRSKTFNAAFRGVSPNLKLPDLVVPGAKKKIPKKQRQAEFRSPAKYFSPNVIDGVISGGKKRLGQYGPILKKIERQTGVPARIILSIWGRESAFGNAKIPYNAFEVLGTKAFMSTRKEYFRAEVLAALQMVGKKGVSIKTMRGSWAGALGQPQFMPSSYLAHARDFDGNRVPDIWKSVPDTLGSIGGYLADKGWVKGRDWGFEVSLPAKVSCALEGPDQGRKISAWAKLGVVRINGKPFPKHELKGEGFLMLPAGRFGPAFIVTPNFFVIKEYNKSDLYALFVGHAGDRIQYGGRAFIGNWGKVGSMYRSDIAKIQRGLEQVGYDVGGADGLPGFKTRRSIGDWQQKNGMMPTCFPESSLIKKFL